MTSMLSSRKVSASDRKRAMLSMLQLLLTKLRSIVDEAVEKCIFSENTLSELEDDDFAPPIKLLVISNITRERTPRQLERIGI